MCQKLRAAAYCRVSTDQTDQLNSLANQQKYFRDYIESHPDWQLVEIYSDEGISGTSTKNRTNFNRMIADAENRKIDLILTKEVSRFARNTMDTLKYTRRLKELHVSVLFINDHINTAVEDDEFQLTLMAALAQKESARTSERVKWGQKRSMENGVTFGRDLLGYSVKNGKLTVNPEEAKTVRLIFHKYLNEGKGTHVIARELDEAGIHPKRGANWSGTVILRILRNEKYVGDLVQQKTFTPSFLSHKKQRNRGDLEKVCLKNHHEPIIDRETWERTQAELESRSPSVEQQAKFSSRYWCSGKLICGECGRHFVSRRKKLKNGMVYQCWRCFAAANYGKVKTDVSGQTVGCNNGSINEKALTACVKYVFDQIPLNKDEIVRDLMKDIRSVLPASSPANPSPILSRISRLESRKKAAIDLQLDGTISKDDLKKQLQAYQQELDALHRQLEEIQKTNRISQEEAPQSRHYPSEINRIIHLEEQPNFLFRELVDTILIFQGNRLTITLNGVPFGFQLCFHTCGRNESYQVIIDRMEIKESINLLHS